MGRHNPSNKVRKGSKSAVDLLKEGEQLDVRDLARKHTAAAVETLKQGMDPEGESPWAVKIKAAQAMLEFGHDRAAVRDPEERSGGIQIVVNQLFTGDGPRERLIDGVQAAIDVKKALEEGAGLPTKDDLAASKEEVLVSSSLRKGGDA